LLYNAIQEPDSHETTDSVEHTLDSIADEFIFDKLAMAILINCVPCTQLG